MSYILFYFLSLPCGAVRKLTNMRYVHFILTLNVVLHIFKRRAAFLRLTAYFDYIYISYSKGKCLWQSWLWTRYYSLESLILEVNDDTFFSLFGTGKNNKIQKNKALKASAILLNEQESTCDSTRWESTNTVWESQVIFEREMYYRTLIH